MAFLGTIIWTVSMVSLVGSTGMWLAVGDRQEGGKLVSHLTCHDINMIWAMQLANISYAASAWDQNFILFISVVSF